MTSPVMDSIALADSEMATHPSARLLGGAAASSARPPCTAFLVILAAWLLARLAVQSHLRRQRQQRHQHPCSPAPLPPGPAGLPLIGSLLELGGNPILKLREFANEYGPVFTIKLGLVKVYVLSEVKIIHEAFVNKGSAFNDRPALIGDLTGGGKGRGMVALSHGRFHHYQRHLTSEIMRSTGIGQQKGEKFFRDGAENACRVLALSQQRPLDSKNALGKLVFRTLAIFLFGEDSESINRLISLRDSPSELFHLNPAVVLASKVFPKAIIDWLMPNKIMLDAFQAILECQRRSYQADPKPLSAAQSFIDGLLAIQHESKRRIQKAETDGDGEDQQRGRGLLDRALAVLAPDVHYAMVFFDFFTVGSETSLVGLLWVLQMLMFHPHWQARIQAELDEVVGLKEVPSLRHKSRLPVTMAVINEVFRFRPTSALGAPHCVSRDTLLAGYLIPKGSLLLSNIFAANNDPKLWCRPDEFDPGRFLDDKGRFHIPQKVLTFSIGQRSCPGEKWTRSLIFIFTTAILQRFTLSFPEGEALPDPNGHPGINFSPNPFKICAKPR